MRSVEAVNFCMDRLLEWLRLMYEMRVSLNGGLQAETDLFGHCALDLLLLYYVRIDFGPDSKVTYYAAAIV